MEKRIINGKAEDVCTTTECTLSAAAIIESMDASIDPCDDFFQFACGGWIAKNPIPDAESRWSQFSVLDTELRNALSTILNEPVSDLDPQPINQAKWFHAACMDEETLEADGVTPLSDLLATYGGWPVSMSVWDSETFDWEEAAAAAVRDVYITTLVGPFVFADERSTVDTVLYIDQPSLGMPRSVLTAPENYEERFTAYKKYISTTARIIASSMGEVIDDADLAQQIDDFVNFEIAVANITTPSEERRDIDRMYNDMTVGDLQSLLTGTSVDFVAFLSSVFTNVGITIDASTRVIVVEVEYIQNLANLLASTDDKVVSNYILWRFVDELVDETTQEMRNAKFEYDMVASGVTAQASRADHCAGESNAMMGMALGLPYVQRYFSEQAKNESNFLVEDLREAFKDLLDINEWMDDETKPLALEKADYISKFIGYPDWYDDENGLEDYYVDLTYISSASDHFGNTEAIR